MTSDRVLSLSAAQVLARQRRRQGQIVVLTNGVFDILHVGHALYLEEARSLGDVLFVGVNSDASVSQIKGPHRPVVPQDERALLLSYLRPVDCVVIFEEATASRLITTIKPHVYVKGGDYTLDSLPETQAADSVGASIRFIPFVSGHSTTSIVEAILHRRPGQ